MLSKIPRVLLAALLLALAAPLSGCELEAEAPVAEYGYEPVYYDGYMVYYDSAGLPYYYMDGGMYYVPRSYMYYDVLVDHYRVYRPYYHRWYVGGGYRYKRYHGGGGVHVGAPVHAGRPGAPGRVYRPAAPGPNRHSPRRAPRSAPRVHSGGHRSGGHHR